MMPATSTRCALAVLSTLAGRPGLFHSEWNEVIDYRSGAARTTILSGKFTGKNSIPVFYLFSFQALVVKEGRRRKKSQREEHRGQEKLQDSVTKVNTEHLVTSRTTC